jgi:hypothetical protein
MAMAWAMETRVDGHDVPVDQNRVGWPLRRLRGKHDERGGRDRQGDDGARRL